MKSAQTPLAVKRVVAKVRDRIFELDQVPDIMKVMTVAAICRDLQDDIVELLK